MEYQKLLEDLRNHYSEKKIFFTKEDERFNSCRDYWRGMIHGVFTKAYYQRKQLFLNGALLYALTFKSYLEDGKIDRDYPSWVIFSPQQIFEEDPLKYYEISEKIKNFSNSSSRKATNRKLKQILNGNYSEPQYLELPSDLTGGYLVYLSTCYVRTRQTPNFRLGINVIIAHKGISKEVVYLPEKYYTSEYNTFYTN